MKHQGTVIADAWIDEAGKVQCVKITRSIPVYYAVVTASRLRWQFQPAMLEGRTIAVVQSAAVLRRPFRAGEDHVHPLNEH